MKRDPGLQPERTQLAWRRTALAGTAVTLLAARLAVIRGTTPGLVAVVALWLTLLGTSQSRIRATARSRPAIARRWIPLLSMIIIGYAVLGLVLLLW